MLRSEINSSGGGTLGRRRMNNGNKGLTASLTRFGKSGSRGCEQLDEVGYGKSPEWVDRKSGVEGKRGGGRGGDEGRGRGQETRGGGGDVKVKSE